MTYYERYRNLFKRRRTTGKFMSLLQQAIDNVIERADDDHDASKWTKTEYHADEIVAELHKVLEREEKRKVKQKSK